MSDELQNRCQELQARIQALEAENERLAERAEEILLLGLVAEQLSAQDNQQSILANTLERIALLKDIPCCLCADLANDEVKILHIYTSFGDGRPDQVQLALSPQAIDQLSRGMLVSTAGQHRERGIELGLGDSSFAPCTVVVIPFATRSIPDGVLLLADDDRRGDRLSPMKALLERIVESMTARLDHLALIQELQHLNAALNEEVEHRLGQLAEANKNLQIEIQERLQVEEALRWERDILRSINETSPAGIVVINREGRITYANRRAEQVLGLTRDEIQQRTYNAPEWRITDYEGHPFPESRLPFEQVMRTGMPVFDARHAIEWPDGRRVLLSVNAAPLFVEDGRVSSMVATVEDVTHRVLAEAELRHLKTFNENIVQNIAEGIVVEDAAGYFTFANPSAAAMLGYTAEELIGKHWAEIVPPDLHPLVRSADQRRILGLSDRYEVELICKDGSRIPVQVSGSPRVDANTGQYLGTMAVFSNIAERKKMEAALQTAYAETRRHLAFTEALLSAIPTPVFFKDAEGRYIGCNPTFADQLGVTSAEMQGKTVHELWPSEHAEIYHQKDLELMRHPERQVYESKVRDKHNQERDVIFAKDVFYDEAGVVAGIVGAYVDITDRKRVEESLRASEKFLEAIFDAIQDGISVLDRDLTILRVNQWMEAMYAAHFPLVGKKCYQVYQQRDQPCPFCPSISSLTSGRSYSEIVPYPSIDAPQGWLELTVFPMEDTNGHVTGVIEYVKNITDRLKAEKALRQSEERYRTIFNTAAVSIWEEDYSAVKAAVDELKSQGVRDLGQYLDEHPEFVERVSKMIKVIDVNDGTLRLLGVESKEKFLGGLERSLLPESFETLRKEIIAIARGDTYFEGEVVDKTPQGEPIHVLLTITFPSDPTGFDHVLVSMMDITARKKAEVALRESEASYRGLFDSVSEAIYIQDRAGRFLDVNRGAVEMYGYPRDFFIGKTPDFLSAPGKNDIEAVCQAVERAFAGQAQQFEFWGLRSNGEIFPKDVRLYPGTYFGQEAVIALAQDITARKQAESQIQQQLQQLEALRQIDTTITSSFDLNIILMVILKQATHLLEVDSAAVLLFKPGSQTLEYIAGHGFRTGAIKNSCIRLGESLAGHAALERHIQITSDQDPNFLDSEEFRAEGFRSYYGVPLIAKGQVKGVLEIFHRTPLSPPATWINFLETLAGQAAIAIHNTELFETLNRSNLELRLAYDTTLEGWARALEIFHVEVSGHSRRITDLILPLARSMGFAEEDLAHIYRAALLHDIGKMGIPAHILDKPGPLTEEEWAIIRKHPQNAVELLAPIPYLRPVIEVIGHHHERWDGSGYPHGLAGEQIPLAARLLAVVDVYEAMCSQRPYRPAFPEAEVIAYLRAQAGIKFDPRVVEKFLEIIAKPHS